MAYDLNGHDSVQSRRSYTLEPKDWSVLRCQVSLQTDMNHPLFHALLGIHDEQCNALHIPSVLGDNSGNGEPSKQPRASTPFQISSLR